MKVVCSQSQFNSAIQFVSRAVALRPTHPILANILLTADVGTNKVSLTGFDLNLGIQTSFSASVEESGAITIPARILSEIVNKLSIESPVSIIKEKDTQNILLKSDRGSYNVRGMSSEDFPLLPLVETGTSIKINPQVFISVLRSTLFASSSDDSKQLLTGVNLTFKNNFLESAATDGHRLSVSKVHNDSSLDINRLDDTEKDIDEILSVTIPSRSLREIEKLISNNLKDNLINLFYDKGQVVIVSSDQIVTTRTLEGKYPNYSRLIPESFSKTLEFSKSELIQALERIAVLADQQSNVVKIIADNNNANLTSDAKEIGNANELIPVNYSGEKLEIAFNVKYLLEGLKVLTSEKVILKCNSPTTPAIIVPNSGDASFIYLVMPVQIKS
tara:strand:+ start:13433 stop:14596 length:1164 start_codon:yes stop_codon:yes gene_type:complete